MDDGTIIGKDAGMLVDGGMLARMLECLLEHWMIGGKKGV
jgi:hypothetical protein